MAKSVTEDEIRDVLDKKSLDIIRRVFSRLEDDNRFKSHHFQLKGVTQADGSVVVSDIKPIKQIVQDYSGFILSEFLAELITTLFEETD